MAIDSKVDAILGAAGAVGVLIQLVADMLGEPVADVRRRVLKVVAETANDPSDETDVVADSIDADLPDDASER